MSYLFSSPALPPGFTLVGNQLRASKDAPAFTGAITIVLTDGISTVTRILMVDRPGSVASALASQVVEMVAVGRSTAAFEEVELITKNVIANAGTNDAFVELDMVTLIASAKTNDAFIRDGIIVVNGVEFEFEFYNNSNNVVPDFASAFTIAVFRPLGSAPPTDNASIGCGNSALPFRNALLAEVRRYFDRPAITRSGCGGGNVNGVSYIQHTFNKN